MASTATHHFTGGGYHYALYKELWDACAGPLVTLPRAGERVYFFPQGYIEQLGAPVHGELEQEMLPFILPSKILCRVIYVQRMAEPETDQVCAQIILLPELDQTEITSPDPPLPEQETYTIHSFHKTLTASDISTRGSLFIYRKHAEDCLPPLDMSQQPPRQDLIAADLHRNKWHFQHIFRGKPKRHVLTTGWNAYVNSKKLAAGDVFIFLRGENGRIHIGVRRLVRQERDISSVMSSENLHLEVLASASHAMTTGSLFCVSYRPRQNSSGFIVNVNKYLEAQKYMYSVGTKFKMRFEDEQILECSFKGTIVGIEDISSRWPDSKWRCLKVQWDEPSSILRPERVSPWELEPLVAISTPKFLPGLGKKRARPCLLPSSARYYVDTWKFPSESPAAFSYYDLYSSSSSSSTSKSNSLGFSGFSSQASISPNRVENVVESSAYAVDEEPGNVGDGCPVLSLDTSDQHSETLNNINQSEIHSGSCEPKKLCPPSPQEIEGKQIRKHVKVKMQGVAVGRSVDLTQMDCHEDLLRELEKMFDIEGKLRGSTKKWEVIYTDEEGDMMLFGDYPWPEFCSMVREIFICASDEIRRMKSRSG
ncbi:auxin response factor 1 isoform X1 [Manihot esculenta]|uniref:Auxin response factor n=1 Tax=Manihot esculenta TaxID=3983 RepID=A0A2C9V5C6_MANES|nr:auxin response factor 1 isoform X1 [Manihot esculenta]